MKCQTTSQIWTTAVTPCSLLLLLAGLLIGCTAVASPPPTNIPIATVPPAGATATILPESLPPTFTPSFVSPATPTVAQPWPTISPTPIVTTTPDIIPTFLNIGVVEALYLDQPPATTHCDHTGVLLRSQFPSQVGGPQRDYHVYLPPCYGQDGRSYPVLYLFHGSIQTDSHWADLGLAKHIDKGIQGGRYPPFIVIMPDNGEIGNNTSGGERSIEAITVNSLIPYVDSAYCTWAEAAGRSIGGISRGGYWALMIAFRHTELFTAVAGHSSQLRLATDAAPYNPLASYAEADLSNMRIWLDWGEQDFLRGGQQHLHDLLTAAGIPHEAHINGGGHNDTYWLVHLREYLDWHTAVWPHDRSAYPPCQQSN